MPVVSLDIPPEIYHRAQRIARQRRSDVQSVLLDSIDLDDETGRMPDAASSEDDAMWREELAFQRLHPELVKRYLGEYVAVLDGQVIDHDRDQVALYKRIRQRYPDQFVLISPVTKNPVEEYVFRSPRIVHNHDSY